MKLTHYHKLRDAIAGADRLIEMAQTCTVSPAPCGHCVHMIAGVRAKLRELSALLTAAGSAPVTDVNWAIKALDAAATWEPSKMRELAHTMESKYLAICEAQFLRGIAERIDAGAAVPAQAPAPDRIMALAEQAARRNHDQAYEWEAFKTHCVSLGFRENFEDCPNPDCRLFAARPSLPVQE